MYKRYPRRRPEVPQGPLTIHLLQERKGTIVPPGTILNSPAPARDSWLAQCQRVPREFWRGMGITARFLSQEMLEDFDMFHSDPGWRIEGTQEELHAALAKHGHRVTFETLEDQAAAAEKYQRDQQERAAISAAIRATWASSGHISGPPQQVELTEIWSDRRIAGSEVWYLGSDLAIYRMQSDYDMGPSWWRTTATREQIERAKALGLKAI